MKYLADQFDLKYFMMFQSNNSDFYPLFKCCCLWIGRNIYLVTKNHLRCRRWLTDLGMKFDKDSWFSKFFKCIVTQIRDILILFKGAQIDTEKCYQVDLYLHVYKTFWSTVYVANSFYDHQNYILINNERHNYLK